MEKEVGRWEVASTALKCPEEDTVAALSIAALLGLAGKCRIEESMVPCSYPFTVADGSTAGYMQNLCAFKT